MDTLSGESVLNLGEDAKVTKSFVAGQPELVQMATDPVILPQPYVQPTDFTAQYPVPLDTTEVISMCEEVNLLRAIPEVPYSLNSYTWREMDTLTMVSGTTADPNYVAFADGSCPEEYTSDGDNFTVYLKNIGAKKTLSIRDIKHSMAVASGGWGINTLVGGFAGGEGLPGGSDLASFQREVVRSAKEKYVRLAMTLVMNGEDRLLVQGNATARPLEFDGIENWATNTACVAHTGTTTSGSGTFAAAAFDQFLAEGCAKPTHIFGHPAAIQEMMSAYFQLGFAGSQLVNFNDGNRITPGFNFAGFVNTGVGRLMVVADSNFRRNAIGGTAFQADLWALRMTHNGEPLVYRLVQIPLSLTDLAPGCTAISFEVWKATCLVIKMCCAQGKYTAAFTGRVVTTCTRIG